MGGSGHDRQANDDGVGTSVSYGGCEWARIGEGCAAAVVGKSLHRTRPMRGRLLHLLHCHRPPTRPSVLSDRRRVAAAWPGGVGAALTVHEESPAVHALLQWCHLTVNMPAEARHIRGQNNAKTPPASAPPGPDAAIPSPSPLSHSHRQHASRKL